MRRPIVATSLAIAACGLLAACDFFAGDSETEVDEGNVSGEVLQGSISDDMVPLDQLRSTAPQAAIVPEAGASGAPVAGGGVEPTDPQASEDAAPEQGTDPAEQPEPAAEAGAGEAAN